MSNSKQNPVGSFFYKEVINKTNCDLTIALERITYLADSILDFNEDSKRVFIFADIIRDIAKAANEKLHNDEEIQWEKIANIYDTKEVSGEFSKN